VFTLPFNDKAGTNTSATVRCLDDELDRSQRREHAWFLSIRTYQLPFGVVIIYFPDHNSDLAINVAYTQRGSQIQGTVTIPVWDLGIDWYIECLATRAVDLGCCFT
jgi:hypothetical protein